MRTPITKAGQGLVDLLRDNGGVLPPDALLISRIVAIEDEAHEQGRRAMDEALRIHATSPEHYPPEDSL